MKKQLHLAIVILFLAAFAAAGVRGYFLRAEFISPIDGTGPQCCADAMLKIYFHVSDGSRTLNDRLARLPRGLPVVIFYPSNNPYANLASQVVGSAVWPRPVITAPVDPTTSAQFVGSLRQQSIAGMLFCALPPPPTLPAGEMVLPGLLLVPVEAK